MITSLSRKMASYLYDIQKDGKTSIEVYRYGLEVLISILVNISLLLTIGFIFQLLNEIVIYMLAFGALRMLAGGYHANSYFSCFIKYTTVALPTIVLIHNMTMPLLVQQLLIVGFNIITLFIVFKYAPVDSIYKPMSYKEKNTYKQRSRVFVTSFSISMILISILIPDIAYFISIASVGVFIESITLLPKLNEKEETRNEKIKC